MDANFWHQRWAENKIGFHASAPNPALVKNIDRLSLSQGSRVFVPLCGKTLDIGWLLSEGHTVIGVELSRKAIEQLFTELGVLPEIQSVEGFTRFSAPDLTIFVGDLFSLTSEMLGQVDAIYDRAALVALPVEMRSGYTSHLVDSTHAAPQLLVTFDYDQACMNGPPFSVSEQEVRTHYSATYTMSLVEKEDMPGGLKGICPAERHVWLLQG